MKQTRKVLAVLLVFGLLYSLTFQTEAKEKYTYKIRIFAGSQGTINGEEVIVYDNLSYGEKRTFDCNRQVTLKEGSKYYAKGIRESGTDSSTIMQEETEGEFDRATITVTGDRDYVVAYGVLGNPVAYTVRYEDESGNELAPSETYYGNIGDRPVIAFLYIENYLPQAYNLTGTLREDASANVFTFVYNPVSTEAAEAAARAAEAARATATPGAAGGAALADGTAQAVADAAANAAATEAAAEADGVEPEDLVSVDDGETPLVNRDLDGDGVPLSNQDFARILLDVPAAAKAGVLSTVVLLVFGIGFLLEYRKRKKKEDAG